MASFDLSSYQPNQSYQLPVELPNNLVSTDGVSTVTLQIDADALVTKTINVRNIRLVNVPAGLQVKVESTRVNNVTVVGPAASVEKLGPGNLEARIDGADLSVSSGMENVPVSIVIPSASDVFVTGSYTVQCSIGEGN